MDLVINTQNLEDLDNIIIDDMTSFRDTGAFILCGAVEKTGSSYAAIWRIDENGIVDPFFSDGGIFVFDSADYAGGGTIGRKVFVDSNGTIHCIAERTMTDNASLTVISLDPSGQYIGARDMDLAGRRVDAYASVARKDEILIFDSTIERGNTLEIGVSIIASDGIKEGIIANEFVAEEAIDIQYASILPGNDGVYLFGTSFSAESPVVIIVRLFPDLRIDDSFGYNGRIIIPVLEQNIEHPKVVGATAIHDKLFIAVRDSEKRPFERGKGSMLLTVGKSEESEIFNESVIVGINGIVEDVAVFREGVFVSGSSSVAESTYLFTIWKFSHQGEMVDPYNRGAYYYLSADRNRDDSAGAMSMNEASNYLFVAGNFLFSGKDDLVLLKGSGNFFQVYSVD